MNADDDIDALLGETIAKVGESPKVAAAAAELEAQIAASRPAPAKRVDPKSLPVRFSRLRQFALSAAHYELSCQGEIDETLALRVGAGFHAGLFLNREVVCFYGRRSGKAWERFERRELERGSVVLNETEYATTSGMLRRVREHKRAMDLLFDATTTERRIDWTWSGRACRGTPDSFRRDGLWQAELKSARCTEPRWLAREALRRFYHAQTNFYDTPIEHATGRVPGDDYIVAVENVPPHNVTVLRFTDEVRELGAKLCRAWWERLLAAEQLGYYGGYVESDVDLELPDYEQPEHESPADMDVEVDGKLVTFE